jgi:NADPH:quinone reductase-like Zn-dependent oxidoreductase
VQVEAFQMQMNMPGMLSKKVIVTGAAGRTGSIVFSLLNKDPRFDAVGLVRSEASAKKLIAKTACNLEEIVVSDVTQMEFEKEAENPHPWPYALDGAEAMVICTSAVPQISKVSIIKAMLKIPMNILTPKKKAINFRDLQFKYKPGQYPEMVDYVGQKKQIDLAKKMGVKHGECMIVCVRIKAACLGLYVHRLIKMNFCVSFYPSRLGIFHGRVRQEQLPESNRKRQEW